MKSTAEAAGMSVVLKVFGHKRYWTNFNFDLMVVLDEKLRNHQMLKFKKLYGQ